jgi:hypothetical protein
MTLVGWKRVLPTVGFPVVQFNPIQQPLMAVGIVPFRSATRYFIKSVTQTMETSRLGRPSGTLGQDLALEFTQIKH